MQLALASNNPGKQQEVTAILSIAGLELVLPSQLPSANGLDPDETGQTFADNALIKARAFAAATGLVSLADDSGLEVTALDGLPGVRSKRFIDGSDRDRNAYLLSLLKNNPDRSARFVAVVCVTAPPGDSPQLPALQDPVFFRGEVSGTIAQSARGSSGFGYDSVFIPDGYDQTFAQLGATVKNKLSHRGRALQAVRPFLKQLV